jgi:integrase
MAYNLTPAVAGSSRPRSSRYEPAQKPPGLRRALRGTFSPGWLLRWPEESVAGPYLDRNRIMEVLCEKAGVRNFRFHALRHFGVSMLEQSGVPVKSIQRLLGHENRTTTELYLHSIGDSERRAIEVLDGNFSEKSHTNLTQTQKGPQTKICNPLS